MNRQSRRDMAMRRQDMRRSRNSRGQFTSDGRNPYGSRGGYVVSDRRDMNRNGRNDMRGNDYQNDMRDYNYDMRDYNDYQGREDERGRRDRNIDMYGAYGNTPFYVRSRDYNDYAMYNRDSRDYGEATKLSKEELEDWLDDLKEEIEPQYKSLYTEQKVEDVAKQMQIEFDKFTPMELLVTTTMLATDYKKSVGQADINRLVAMGKEWLCDKDAKVKYGEKLSAYHDAIVMGE